MLASVELQNFKNFLHQKIDLERLTVFVGANSSGKTSVLEGIHLAVNAVTPDAPKHDLDVWQPRPEKVFGSERHCDWLYTRGGSGDLRIACTTSAGTFAILATPPKEYPPRQIEHFGRGLWEFSWAPADDAALKAALEPAKKMAFLRLNSTKLAKATYSDRAPPRVEFDGHGLAPVLAYMALNDPDGFEQLVEEMRRLIPTLRRIRFTKAIVHHVEKEYLRVGSESVERRSKREFQGDAILFDFENANDVAAHAVGEGTLLLLGLLTVILGPSRPRILLLDDIEHGLHPLAQTKLLEILSQIMQRLPDLQVLASAHSPYLLDALRPEQVRLMTIGPDGHSVCGCLMNHPQFEQWKDEMAPGELWSLFGEKWIADGSVPR